MLSKRLYGAAMMAAVVIPSTLVGCGDDASNPLCCNEFKAGATISADIGGGAESQVAVQAVADFSGIASAAVDDLTTACRGIATDLDAPKDKRDAAEAQGDKKDRLKAWCQLAVEAIGTFKGQAQATLTVNVVPPKCEASVSAKANCQAKCSGSASCDIKANPPKCTGGKLEVSCKGSCTAEAGATLKCEGKCTGSCKGSCTASGGVAVQCNGKCDGKCSADAQGNGNGLNAQGECTGFCDATCTAKADAPAVECSGSCNGECSASCEASANASVKCDGKCEGDFEPLKCEGGKLEGGCQVEAKCDANCDASVQAKAECTPPNVEIGFTGTANAEFSGRLKATLEANLPLIFAFRARLQGMADIAGTFSGNISAVTDIKAACIPAVVGAVGTAVENVNASLQASVSVVGSVGGS